MQTTIFYVFRIQIFSVNVYRMHRMQIHIQAYLSGEGMTEMGLEKALQRVAYISFL